MAFKISPHSDNTPIIYADTDEDFRAGCADAAVSKALSLLNMLKREHGVGHFDEVFRETIIRAIDLLVTASVVAKRDSFSTSELADRVFGEEWLIGTLDRDGEVVVADMDDDEVDPMPEQRAMQVLSEIVGEASSLLTGDATDLDLSEVAHATLAIAEARKLSRGVDITAGVRLLQPLIKRIGAVQFANPEVGDTFEYAAMGSVVGAYIDAARSEGSQDLTVGLHLGIAIVMSDLTLGCVRIDPLSTDFAEEPIEDGYLPAEPKRVPRAPRAQRAKATA